MWPMRGHGGPFGRVTSTPHFSQIDAAVLSGACICRTGTRSPLIGPKIFGAEQAVTLGLEGAVVDGSGFFSFAEDHERIFSGRPGRCLMVEMLIRRELFETSPLHGAALLSLRSELDDRCPSERISTCTLNFPPGVAGVDRVLALTIVLVDLGAAVPRHRT